MRALHSIRSRYSLSTAVFLLFLRAFRVGAPNVPVVVSSGSSEEEIREMFSAHPYDVFLAKPYTLAELKRAVSVTRS